MTNEISNKTLAFLLVGAIVVSLFGTFVSLDRLNKIDARDFELITGFATEGTGTVDLSVDALSSFRLAQIGVDFGTIQPNSTGFWISTETTNAPYSGGNDCTTVLGACSGIEIENDGNERINISFNTSFDADSLIGGTLPAFKFKIINGNRTGIGNENGCNGTILHNVTWQEITADTVYPICTGTFNTGFMPQAQQDRITMEFNLTIPNDAPQAATQATIELSNAP